MDILSYDSRRFFLFGVRIFFGVWLLYVGLVVKWFIMGPGTFAGFIVAEFDKTWSPHFLNLPLAWLILVAEPALAILILSGMRARLVWTLTALFLFMLTIGQTILMKPDVYANWLYLLLALGCAALSGPDDTRAGSDRS
jgi:hypothetical protein